MILILRSSAFLSLLSVAIDNDGELLTNETIVPWKWHIDLIISNEKKKDYSTKKTLYIFIRNESVEFV